ncbi:redox-sensing transcriptional repressor Rex [Megalodesulfovibrio gigas]|uniref:Redox-sensing transcriptional repressor Rex n=1 Tax=Megalodesulfovibrio gigas (strain ATCC 19364 / DSM 1382 / NCIMB 9332 / VKM B-1759) TaxID=1121448 RepID=T2G9S4_MEGG1|nr:redox-sensing transcriptional repressor Rex [Megalodesulfovibrio gigas]AGW13345.1 putative redox-sensing transcriptional repressor Rex [Megalodesulfovibrio gigas DSM 1382 = ATCC 19364]
MPNPRLFSLKSDSIPRATIQRLALYVQVLEDLQREGADVISSESLAKACDVNPSQIRKDLAYFGKFGVRGVGYYIQDLIASLKRCLGIDHTWKTVLVGVGNLGRALLNHKEFKLRGFEVIGAFDCDPFKIGEEVSGLEVMCTKRLMEKSHELGVEIGIITTPPERAQRAANHLVEAGIKGILNFAPARITVPEHVVLEYVDFFHHLYSVAFNITLSQQK